MAEVKSFTGKRVGPTVDDLEHFAHCVEQTHEGLLEPNLTAYAVTRIVWEDGTHKTSTEWAKMPGVGLNELVGAAAILQADLIKAMD